MTKLEIGQNFTHNNYIYKITNITSAGIRCINIDTKEYRIFKMFDLIKLIKNK